MDDYLTMEFLNELEVFEFKPKPAVAEIEVYCVEINENDKNQCFDCAICMDTHLEINRVVLNCKHKFCYSCISTYLTNNNNNKPVCALCREVYKLIEIPDMYNLLYIATLVNQAAK
jgi:hypothetical protein